jgi:zinc transporter, ZIP family
MSEQSVAVAFGLTVGAGLATGIGSALALVTKRTNTQFLSLSLGFSAGVMIYVSFVDILPKGQASLAADLGKTAGAWAATVAFFGGMGFVALIDRLVPAYENPHEPHRIEDLSVAAAEREARLVRMGIMSAVAIAIHNFPEGLAVFASALDNPQIGTTIAVAISLHNIPEGIAVSVPVFYATGSRRKAFAFSFLSGLAEPAGALVGYFFLLRYLGPALRGAIFAAVAGIMVFISLDELLPTAREYGQHHLAVYGMLAGMGLMALSLLLFM